MFYFSHRLLVVGILKLDYEKDSSDVYVHELQVTQGVPRIKEIINGSKKISTPIMDVSLEIKESEIFARLVQGRVEKKTLGQVADHIETVFKPGRCTHTRKAAMSRIRFLNLDACCFEYCRRCVYFDSSGYGAH